MMETLTDKELIEELAGRHNELIVIRPMGSNKAGSENRIKVFCKTTAEEAGYDLFEACELLHEAQIGIMRDSFVNGSE